MYYLLAIYSAAFKHSDPNYMPKFRHQLSKILGQDPTVFLADKSKADASQANDLVEKSLALIELSDQQQDQRKKLSREIGIAKRAGNPAEPIIEQVAALSTEIGELDNEISDCMAQLRLAVSKDEPEEQTVLAPRHFLPNSSVETSPVDSDLSVACEQPFPQDEWQQYVEQHESSTAYHDARWHELLKANFGHEPHYLTARCNGKITGVLPLIHMSSKLFGSALISLPYVNYSGVLADNSVITAALLEAASGLSATLGASHFELRDTAPMAAPATKTHKVSMVLPLPQSDSELDTRLGSKLRAQIKRAQQHGLTFKYGGVELVESFYQVFSHNMRDLGTPVYNRRLFMDIIRQFPDKASIAVVFQDDTPLAAGFLIAHNDKMEIPWASSLRRSNHLGTNMFLYRAILAKSIEQGYEFFDFGRSSIGASTHKFKRQWGAREFPLYWHYWLNDSDELPEVNPQNPKYQLAISAWKRLPLPLANTLGPHLAKNLP